MMIFLAVWAFCGPSVGFVVACLLGAARHRDLIEQREDARYENDVNEALLVASQSMVRPRDPWTCIAGTTGPVLRPGRW